MRSSYQGAPGPGKRGLSALRIVIIIVLVAALTLIIFLLRGRSVDQGKNSVSATPTAKATTTATPAAKTPEPAAVAKNIPRITVKLDELNYKIKGTEDASEVSRTGEIQTVGMGKGSVLQVDFDQEPSSYSLSLYKDDKLIFNGKTNIIIPEDIPANGEYRAVCKAIYDTKEYSGTALYIFNVEADFPPLPVISATETLPGELLVITVKYVDPEDEIKVETDLDFKPNIFDYDNKKVILQPVSYYNKAGKIYSIKLTIGEDTHSFAVQVNEKEFTIQHLTIDPKIEAETRNDESARERAEKIDPLKPVCDDVPYWRGDFIMPVVGGRVREYDFGKRRYVNGSPTSYRHNGLDIGHDEGVPVMAANNGRVLIAEYLIQTGNTVIIEHGFGLKTWYYHMSELNVKTGDMVEKGQVIGKVGSTGFSTGPHLHFSASVNSVYINPITLINEGVPLLAIDD